MSNDDDVADAPSADGTSAVVTLAPPMTLQGGSRAGADTCWAVDVSRVTRMSRMGGSMGGADATMKTESGASESRRLSLLAYPRPTFGPPGAATESADPPAVRAADTAAVPPAECQRLALRPALSRGVSGSGDGGDGRGPRRRRGGPRTQRRCLLPGASGSLNDSARSGMAADHNTTRAGSSGGTGASSRRGQ